MHYVKIALGEELIEAFAEGPAVLAVDHPQYAHESELTEATRRSLVADWG